MNCRRHIRSPSRRSDIPKTAWGPDIISASINCQPQRHHIPADRLLAYDPLSTATAGHSPSRRGPIGGQLSSRFLSKASPRPGAGQEIVKRHAKAI